MASDDAPLPSFGVNEEAVSRPFRRFIMGWPAFFFALEAGCFNGCYQGFFCDFPVVLNCFLFTCPLFLNISQANPRA